MAAGRDERATSARSRSRSGWSSSTASSWTAFWVPLAMLRRLAVRGHRDRQFTEATAEQERVLVAHSPADRHNETGLHRGTGLSGFLDAIPYEPTPPFTAVPDD